MDRSTDEPTLLIALEEGLASTFRRRVRDRLASFGVQVYLVEGQGRNYLEVHGDVEPLRTLALDSWRGIEKVLFLGPANLHVGKRHVADDSDGSHGADNTSKVQVGSVIAGEGNFTVVAGPCAVEEEERTLRLAASVATSGAHLFRGGAFKPRTSPYAFQGLGDKALQILTRAREETGLGIVTEVLDPRDVEKLAPVADLLQVGSRNMHNYSLLRELGQSRIPILLKRGFSSTSDEFLLAAEYILSGGNPNVILCERGIRCAAATRQVVLDLGIVPELKKRTHLPVFVDPSHGSAEAYRVPALACAAVAAGADGLLIEVHDQPEQALSDGRQALSPEEFKNLVPDLYSLHESIQSNTSRALDAFSGGPVTSTSGREEI